MKPRLHCITTFNLRLMGVMPVVALSLVLYPAIVKAEITSEKLLLPNSHLQADKGIEDRDFSRDLENFSVYRAEDLNSSSSRERKLVRRLDFALVFPNDVKSRVEDRADRNKVAEKSIDSNSPHLLGSSERHSLPLKFASTSSISAPEILDVQASETEIQPFQPKTSVDLSRDLGKIAGIEDKNDERKNTETLFHASPTEIQPFQPVTSVGLFRGLRKIAGVEDAGTRAQGVNKNLPVSPTVPIPTTIKILTPTADSVVDVQASTVIVQFPAGNQVELRVNGVLVDPSLVGRTETDATTNLVTQTWYGVSLKEGANTISAQLAGGTEPPVTVQVAVRGTPQQLTLETVESRIPADGRSTATIRGQLIDANGNRSNRDAVVTLIPSAGELVGKDFKPDEPGFQVEAKGGQFTATLRSQLKAETVTIRAIANDLEAFTQLQFETALRPSLVTGVIDLRLGARGTNYYGSFRDFLPPDKNNGTQLDFHSAIFATGAIGEWLFTGAYNSSRSLNEDCNCDNRLFRTYQFSEQNYPVYGDSSKVDVVAPSIDSVFLRFERSARTPGSDPDYAMWGDYNTEEFARRSQQFTSITRQLHGFKANYNLGNLQITGFYGDHLEGFQRDTIAPDGTSGYYFLSRRLLQPEFLTNSEKSGG